MQTRSIRRWPAALALLAVVAAACGGGGGSEATTSTTTASTVPSTTTTTAPPPTAPLTGEVIDDESILGRKALVVKIDNNNVISRPQNGLVEADIVFEELVEGGVTRLFAVLHSEGTDLLGPIRSGRTTDIELVANLGTPLFAWSGANTEVRRRLRAADLIDVGFDLLGNQRTPDGEPYYYRRSGRRSPSNLYSSTGVLWQAQPEDASGPPPALFTYRAPEQPLPAGAEAVSSVDVNFGGREQMVVRWEWDDSVGGWRRIQAGSAHVDDSGDQIVAENVIVRFTAYRDSGYVDTTGASSPEAVMTGDGEAWVFVDGHVVRGTFSRPTLADRTIFRDATGAEIALDPGATWVELPRIGSTVTVEAAPAATTTTTTARTTAPPAGTP